MVPAARIQAVIELVDLLLHEERPADALASAYFRERRFIGSGDRAGINKRFFRIQREYHRLCWWLQRAGFADVTARLIVLADLVLHGEDPFKVFGADHKYAPEKLDDAERKLCDALKGEDFDHPDMPERVRHECPEWAAGPLKDALGDDFGKELEAMQSRAPLDLRVNTIKTTRDAVLERFKQDGIKAYPGKISPLCIRLHERPNLSQHPLFKDGHVEVQDQGSQMVAVVADAKPGEQVVDFCAGAGGKALAMGASMDNKGRIVAMDVLGGRLKRSKTRFRRAGLHNIETRELSSERDKWVKRHKSQFDLVLVDAPCTGTGTWRRDPDKRWRMLGPGLDSLVPLQAEILDSAARLVKPGGRLVYATCSLLPEENERQVEKFLENHPDFQAQPAGTDGQGSLYLKLTPAQNDTDGFFAAVLRRGETE